MGTLSIGEIALIQLYCLSRLLNRSLDGLTLIAALAPERLGPRRLAMSDFFQKCTHLFDRHRLDFFRPCLRVTEPVLVTQGYTARTTIPHGIAALHRAADAAKTRVFHPFITHD
jgi:hypothetical protein